MGDDRGGSPGPHGARVRVTHSATPEGVDWQDIDLVVECSGKFSARPDLQRFIDAGCPRLLLSNPGARAEDVDATIVPGVTHHTLKSTAKIVSAASCTTNAVVQVLSILSEAFSLEQVLLTTLHSAMNDQPLIDGYHHSDLARTRSAMQSIIPVTTGLARGVERLLPALAGRVEAKAIRVPTHNVSAIDMVLALKGDVCAKRINALLEEAAQGRWSRLIDWSDAPHASIDFNHDPHSAIVEGAQTRACGNGSANIFLWFDNEWGFANRMVELALHWLESFRAERG